jgi:hypothetical protein
MSQHLLALLLLAASVTAVWQQVYKDKSATSSVKVSLTTAATSWDYESENHFKNIDWVPSVMVDEQKKEIVMIVRDYDGYHLVRVNMETGKSLSSYRMSSVYRGALESYALVNAQNMSVLIASWSYKAGWSSECNSTVSGFDTATGSKLFDYQFACSTSWYEWDRQVALSKDGTKIFVQEMISKPGSVKTTEYELNAYAFPFPKGAMLWKTKLTDDTRPFRPYVIVDDDNKKIYATTGKKVFQLNTETGNIENQLSTTNPRTTILNPEGNVVYHFTNDENYNHCYLSAHDQSTFKTLYEKEVPLCANRALYADSVLVSVSRTMGNQISVKDGSVFGQVSFSCNDTMGKVATFVQDTTVVAYACTRDNSFTTWDLKTGQQNSVQLGFSIVSVISDEMRRIFACGYGDSKSSVACSMRMLSK